MHFQPTPIGGAFEISIDWQRDPRGAFGRTFCRQEFAAHGLNPDLFQCSVSQNSAARTVRGFHLQAKPHEEAKLVHCIGGRIFDVALDLRTGSPTYGRHHAVELSAAIGKMLYIPEGCAHGYQALESDTSSAEHRWALATLAVLFVRMYCVPAGGNTNKREYK